MSEQQQQASLTRVTRLQMPPWSRPLLLKDFAFGALGCVISSCITSGCITSGPGEYGVSAEVRELRLELCPDGLIDDAEDNNGQINTLGGRDGYWFTFKDEVGSTIDPDASAFHMSEGGPPGSKYAAVMKGKMGAGGPNIYPYVGMGFNLSNPKQPFDAGKAQGIQFWARGPGRIRFKTPDIMTDPVGEKCSDCYNDFGVDIFLDETWQRYTVPFNKLEQQPGWGDRAPRVAKDQLFAIQWQFGTAGKEYDVAIDNVAFVGCGQ